MNDVTPPLGEPARRASTPALWPPVRASYAPLRDALAEAERRLNSSPAATSPSRWRRLADAANDRDRTAAAVDELLAATIVGWHLGDDEGRPRVLLTGNAGLEPTEIAAVQALALLVESGGVDRLKRCRRGGCAQVFLDWTNAGTRRVCRAHGRKLP